MKLHNLLLTAALFLTAGAAFASSEDYADYYWNNKDNWNKIDVTLTKFQQQTEFQYSVYDVDAYKDIMKTAENDGVKFANDNKKMEYALSKLEEANKIWVLKDPGENNSMVTVINLPEGTEVNNFGVIGHQKVLSVPNVSNNFYFYTTTDSPSNTVFYGKLDSDEGHGNNKAAKITFGQPLPAPVVTLLIALGFGVALVMYRNRKQAKA